MNKLTILVGNSCSGKSTLARKIAKENPNTYIISRDDERLSLFGEYRMGTDREEKIITYIMNSKLYVLEDYVTNVVIDNTHLKLKYVRHWTEMVEVQFDEIEVIMLPLFEYDKLNFRNHLRYRESKKLIPETVLQAQLESYKSVYNSKEWEDYCTKNNIKLTKLKQHDI